MNQMTDIATPQHAGDTRHERARATIDRIGIADLYPFAAHFLKLPTGEMHNIDEGTGDPVLMVHGNPTWSFLYREFVTALSPDNRVIAPDHLGFGLSDKPDDEASYTLDYHIKNLEALVIHLDLKNITLVVHDWGGPIGLGMASRHPDRIKSIVVMNSFGLYPMSEKMDPENIKLPFALKILRTKGFGTLLTRYLGLFERVIMRTATDNTSRLKSVKSAYRDVFSGPEDRAGVTAFPRMIPTNSRHPAAQIMINEISPYLKSYDKPMRIFWGQKDPFMVPEILEGWIKYNPRAEVTTIPDASHYIQEDAFETLIPQMNSFIKNT